jgi:hypothetical protein
MLQAGQILPNDLVWAQGSTSPTTVMALLHTAQGDATGGLIPYKNGPALTSYYLGVASLIPCLGILAAIPALILGFKGLKKVKAQPWVRGTAHAWVGIILGGGMLLLNLAAIVFILSGAAANM